MGLRTKCEARNINVLFPAKSLLIQILWAIFVNANFKRSVAGVKYYLLHQPHRKQGISIVIQTYILKHENEISRKSAEIVNE